jgi:hypothetical protein
MSSLIRWNGYLEKEQLSKLKDFIKRKFIKGSVSWHIREALDKYLERIEAQSQKD